MTMICILTVAHCSLQYRDLDQTAQVAFTVWEIREGQPRRTLAGTTLRLFSKKGRLKTGTQMLKLWLPGPADHGWPSRTPGKMPLAQGGEQGCGIVAVHVHRNGSFMWTFVSA